MVLDRQRWNNLSHAAKTILRLLLWHFVCIYVKMNQKENIGKLFHTQDTYKNLEENEELQENKVASIKTLPRFHHSVNRLNFCSMNNLIYMN